MNALIDIETLPRDATVGMDLTTAPGWSPSPTTQTRRTPPSNYKDPAKIAEWEEAEDRRYLAAIADEVDRDRESAIANWRDGVFRFADVRIACIGVSYGGFDQVVFDCLDPEREADAIRGMLQSLPQTGAIMTWGDYDARVIRARCLALGIRMGPFASWQRKPWDSRIVDVQREIAAILNGSQSNIRGISVDAICDFLGIERSKNPISGAGVLDAYVAGRGEDVIAHCLADVIDEWAVVDRVVCLAGS